MIVGFGWPVESGKDSVYSFRQRFRRILVAEKDIGAGVIKIEGSKAKLWSWEMWFRMWTTSRFTVADLLVRVPDRLLEILKTYFPSLSFLRSSSSK